MVAEDGSTRLAGVRVVGDLTGIPLLKFSAHSGARAVRAFLAEPDFGPGQDPEVYDLAIVGAGVSGMAAAKEAAKAGLRFAVFEAAAPFQTLRDFPKRKPIYTYPTDMAPDGDLVFEADVKEGLVEELEAQTEGIEVQPARIERITKQGDALALLHADGHPTRARRVIVAIGRSGNHRKLNVPGEALEKVYPRLHDPADFADQKVMVVGGGDSALEAAIALAEAGAEVRLSYRKSEFSRPKPENVERLHALDGPGPGRVQRHMKSHLSAIRPDSVDLETADGTHTLPNDVVFTLIGREAPLDFFRRSGIPIHGEWRASTWLAFVAFFAFCTFVYHWKGFYPAIKVFEASGWFPFGVPSWLGLDPSQPSTLGGTLAITLKKPGFYYTLAYTVAIVAFGVDRIRRRKTPYVTAQTLTLMGFQILPLFLLPYVLLPWLGHNGWFDDGALGYAADQLFPRVGYDHGREYWRAFGFVLAWPLFIWNFFTDQPMTWWLVIGGLQTFVLIPLMVFRFGKGAYCGWICSCGALAETLGDRHRHKMPHGPIWNRLNMIGQVLLAVCFFMFGARILSWTVPETGVGQVAAELHRAIRSDGALFGLPILNYQYLVDLWFAGVVGVGLYFWFSGRVWCRFGCPLAALMHIYARFSRFRIFAEKKKCISCNVCTSVCHQGIDVMGFANKGKPMEDPECVRCSACVQSCPTGVLAFGRYDGNGLVQLDTLKASAVRAREAR